MSSGVHEQRCACAAVNISSGVHEQRWTRAAAFMSSGVHQQRCARVALHEQRCSWAAMCMSSGVDEQRYSWAAMWMILMCYYNIFVSAHLVQQFPVGCCVQSSSGDYWRPAEFFPRAQQCGRRAPCRQVKLYMFGNKTRRPKFTNHVD